MGIFSGIFGRKIDCYQCETMVKERNTLFRRGLRFCSPNCLQQFLVENPPTVAQGGTPAEYTQAAIMELNAAISESSIIVRATGGFIAAAAHRGIVGNIHGGGAAVIEFDEAANAVGRFYDHVRTVLPYLYALGRTQEGETLETIDLDPILMMSRAVASHGGLQQSNMRSLASGAHEKVTNALHQVAMGQQ